MKRVLSLLALLIAAAPLISSFPGKSLAADNLIANPSVETALTSDLPASWSHGSVWGNLNVNFTYENSGYNSNRSVKVAVTNYQSGDAKWQFDQVAISPNQKYVYSDYYKSDSGSELVAAITDSNNQVSYQWLAWTAPSDTWKNLTTEFTTPNGAAKITVLHLLLGNGYLQTDDFSLRAKEDNNGGIVNPGFEEANPANPAMPNYWHTNSWGTSTANFSYLNTGYQSNRSARIDVSNYQSGDSKWWYDPIPVQPGQSYIFEDNYKSNITTRAVVWITTDTGADMYLGLRSVPASGSWASFHDSFTAPYNAKFASVLHIIEGNGYLNVDNYSFSVGEVRGFSRPLVTLTFDDGWEDNVTTALPVMQQYGFRSTQFYATQFINGQSYQSLDNVRQFIAAGHEIGSHTVTHPDLTTLSIKQLIAELSNSKNFLEKTFRIKITNFASPYGAYNQTVINYIGKYYRSHRTVDVGYNSKDNFDIMRLKVQNMTPQVTISEYQSWLDQAKANNLWLILVYHKVSDQDVEAYDTTVGQFVDQMGALNSTNVHVSTMQEALNEVVPQL